MVTTASARLVMERADELARLTEVPGEITRPYGSASLREALDRVAGWMEEAGLTTRRDAVGNVIGRRGAPEVPTFLLGSHIDSVRNAGRYDGPLGVLTAIAAAAATSAEAQSYALEVVCFADEEGLRFRSSYLGSRAFAGLLDPDELDMHDDDEIALRDAVAEMGGDPDALPGSPPRDGLLGYLEVHIEQGPVLEANDLPVGIVTAIAGQSRGFVDFAGEAGHAGNTPPALRRDALCGAAELVLAVEREMSVTAGLIATVGRIDNEPDVGNVIPGRTTVSYDVRHQDDDARDAAVERLRAAAAEITARRGLELSWRHLQDHPAVAMSDRLRRLLRDAVEHAGAEPYEMPSGAGHDAVSIAHLTDVAMLFVRCERGVSHHPAESIREDDAAVAVEVVAELLRRLGRDGDDA